MALGIKYVEILFAVASENTQTIRCPAPVINWDILIYRYFEMEQLLGVLHTRLLLGGARQKPATIWLARGERLANYDSPEHRQTRLPGPKVC